MFFTECLEVFLIVNLGAVVSKQQGQRFPILFFAWELAPCWKFLLGVIFW